MSDPIVSIRAAFVTRLLLFPSLPPVAWENVAYTPTIGTTYIAPYLLPGEPIQVEIGTAGANRYTGVFQISIFAPTGSGIAAINTLAGALCDYFKRGTTVSYGGLIVSCQKAYSAPVLQETDWQHLPITIRYVTTAAN